VVARQAKFNTLMRWQFGRGSAILTCNVAFGICILVSMSGGVVMPKLSAATGAQVDPKIPLKLTVVGKGERFGVPTEFTLADASGVRFNWFCECGVMEEMLSRNISLQFRHNQQEKHDKTVVVGVYPKVFTAGCVVVIEIDGPLPRN